MLKKISKLILGLLLLFISYSAVNAAAWDSEKSQVPYCQSGSECSLQKGIETVKSDVDGIRTEGTFSSQIQRMVIYIISFVSIIGVLIIIFAGFNILTSAGDAEKMKKSKNMILYVGLGVILIWLAYPIFNWILGLIGIAVKKG